MVFPTNGAVTTVKGIEIIVIGGLGSIPGALVGGVLLGLIESLGAASFPHPIRTSTAFCSSSLFSSSSPMACLANAGGRLDGNLPTRGAPARS
jgi:branched-chain amino acid transport system permease protein